MVSICFMTMSQVALTLTDEFFLFINFRTFLVDHPVELSAKDYVGPGENLRKMMVRICAN